VKVLQDAVGERCNCAAADNDALPARAGLQAAHDSARGRRQLQRSARGPLHGAPEASKGVCNLPYRVCALQAVERWRLGRTQVGLTNRGRVLGAYDASHTFKRAALKRDRLHSAAKNVHCTLLLCTCAARARSAGASELSFAARSVSCAHAHARCCGHYERTRKLEVMCWKGETYLHRTAL
jgi:hypothetical protein